MTINRSRQFVAAAVVVVSAVCLSIAHAGEIYWSSDWYSEPALWRASLEGGNTETVATGATQAIALDLVDRKIYWGEFLDLSTPYYNVTIQRANLDGSDPETRYDLQTNSVYSMALDRDHGWIFASLWAADDCVGIKRFEMHDVGDASDGITIASGHCIHGVAVDPEAGKVYWAEVFPERAIRRADKLYWTSFSWDMDRLHRADLDGSNAAIAFPISRTRPEIAIDPFPNDAVVPAVSVRGLAVLILVLLVVSAVMLRKSSYKSASY